jgi:hypothetical protein
VTLAREPLAPGASRPVPSGQRRWRWYSEFQPRLVELSSPYSPDECVRPLEARTTQRRSVGWLGSFTREGARVRLFGRVSPLGIRVSRLADGGRYSYLRPWFDGRIDLAPDGGTVIRGSVGPSPTALRGFLAFLVAEGAGCVYFAANGLDWLLTGHPLRAAGYLVAMALVTALSAAAVVTAPRRMRNRAQGLLREIDYTLRSTHW